MQYRTMALAALSLSALTFGCGDDAPANPDAAPEFDAAPSPECLEATLHSDLTYIQEKIFTPSCSGFSACHKGRALSAAGLNLEAGTSRTALLGVASTLFPQFQLVVAGQPAESYLMVILGHIEGPLTDKGTMPYNNPLLCVEKREAIARWIAAGALDD